MSTTGLVLVSHSRALGLALKEMLDHLYGGRMPVAVAAGAGDEHAELGTDATAIMAAVEEIASSSDGVLVLLDLGSAILSAEMALELLDDDTRKRVALCAAPLVEGAVAAGAQCSIGASLDAVRAEAEQALRQKQEHLGTPATKPEPATETVKPSKGPVASMDLLVENVHGLHARPAMRIVQALANLRASVEMQNLRTESPAASARSLVEITCLGVRAGDTVRIIARGEDAAEAIRALENLHAEQFGEAASPDSTPEICVENPVPTLVKAPEPDGEAKGGHRLRGRALSGGIAIGPMKVVQRAAPMLPPPVGSIDPATEMARLQSALHTVRQQLAEETAAAAARFGKEHAAILQVQQILAEDPALLKGADALIGDPQNPLPATHAWQQASRATAAVYRQLPDLMLRERARDVEDLEGRVLRTLGASSSLSQQVSGGDEPCILVTSSLLPSEVTALDPRKIMGIIAESIGGTSHAAILLRAASIPVVDGIPPERLAESLGKNIALDGGTGEVWIDPDATTRAELAQRKAASEANQSGVAASASIGPLRTRDGQRIELAANAASVAEARAALRAGAEGIGLLRTEFLFLDRSGAPTEEEQATALSEIAAEFPSDAPVTIRTLDIGGDKPVPFLPVAHEENPFLGVRGLRLSLRQPEMFLIHLRAILRAGHGRRFRVMFPMVTEQDEIHRAKALLAEAHAQLTQAAQDHAWPVETGMMIEVPGAALLAARFAPEVDFFSIGTNDLTQYTLAAERGHPVLTGLSDAMHPAVLRLIALVTTAARRHGKWVGVCGEAAAEPLVAGVFVGLGVRELSMGTGALGHVRATIANLDARQAHREARHRMHAATAAAARMVSLEAVDLPEQFAW